jgi:chemotaxis response regulator CheB
MTSAAAARDFRPRVFIIEDEYFLADDLARHFAQLGAEVVGFAPSAARAIDIIKRSPPVDVAVLDVWLLDGNVFTAADLLLSRGVCVVFYTALARDELPERYQRLTIVGKPASAAQVYEEVVHACAQTAYG